MTSSVLHHVDRLFSDRPDDDDVDIYNPSQSNPPQGCDQTSDNAATALQSSVDFSIDTLIDNEIRTHYKKNTAWSKLDLCFKWSLIRAYMIDSGVAEHDALIDEVKEMLISNRLPNVEYDKFTHKVVKLNHGTL